MTLAELEKRLLTAEKRLKEAEKQIRINADIDECMQLQHKYINALARIDWDEIVSCFAEKGTIDVQFGGFIRGKAKINKFFHEMLSQIHIGKEGIFAVHPIITIDGDKAHGNWLMYIMYADHRTWASRYWLQGIYDVDFVREKGEWKFGYLQWRPRLEPPGVPPPTLAP